MKHFTETKLVPKLSFMLASNLGTSYIHEEFVFIGLFLYFCWTENDPIMDTEKSEGSWFGHLRYQLWTLQ